MTDKITSSEIHTARLVISTLDDGQTEMPAEVRENLIKFGNHDPDVIQHLVTRILKEGTLAEEQHRYLAKGVYDEWVEPGNDSMPDEILDEFTLAGDAEGEYVKIDREEFKDILAYIAREYYG